MNNEFEPLGVAVILRRGNKYAFCKRIATDRDFYGQWALAGGGVENEELHNPELAAIREVLEETGYNTLLPVNYIGYSRREGGRFLGCLYYVTDVPDFITLRNTEPHKHTDWEWLTKEEALQRDLVAFIPEFLKKV